DVVFCIEVLEHLTHPDKALRRLLTMLNTRGVAILTVPNGRLDTFEGHINFWSPESWEVFIREVCNGCVVETGLMDDERTNFAVVRKDEGVKNPDPTRIPSAGSI